MSHPSSKSQKELSYGGVPREMDASSSPRRDFLHVEIPWKIVPTKWQGALTLPKLFVSTSATHEPMVGPRDLQKRKNLAASFDDVFHNCKVSIHSLLSPCFGHLFRTSRHHRQRSVLPHIWHLSRTFRVASSLTFTTWTYFGIAGTDPFYYMNAFDSLKDS